MQQIAFTIHFCIAFFCGRLLFPSSLNFYFLHRCIKMKLHLIFQFGIQLFQNYVVDIRSQMTDGSIQKLQTILHTELLELGSRRRKKPGPFSSMFHIDFINIFHEREGFFFSDIFIESTAKIVRDIVFPVGKCPRSAKTAHNRTTLTGNTGLDFLPVNRTVPLFQAMPSFQNHNRKSGILLYQLIRRINSAGSRTDDSHIIILHFPSLPLNTNPIHNYDLVYHNLLPFA